MGATPGGLPVANSSFQIRQAVAPRAARTGAGAKPRAGLSVAPVPGTSGLSTTPPTAAATPSTAAGSRSAQASPTVSTGPGRARQGAPAGLVSLPASPRDQPGPPGRAAGPPPAAVHGGWRQGHGSQARPHALPGAPRVQHPARDGDHHRHPRGATARGADRGGAPTLPWGPRGRAVHWNWNCPLSLGRGAPAWEPLQPLHRRRGGPGRAAAVQGLVHHAGAFA